MTLWSKQQNQELHECSTLRNTSLHSHQRRTSVTQMCETLGHILAFSLENHAKAEEIIPPQGSKDVDVLSTISISKCST